jgi:DNA repair exonuclease SbcCD ATPase subunit
MRKIPILLILLIFVSSAYADTFYKWVDEQGVVNFTDDYNKVPLTFHNRVEKEFLQEEGTPIISQGIISKIKEQIRTDIYGRDETWWKEKVRLWRERLKEATENYDKVYSEFMGQAERLVQVKFGSKTQYQMVSYVLSGLTQQLEEYRAQITKAEEMLDELSKEAEEAKANPEWLEPPIGHLVQNSAPTRKGEINTDLYGRNRTWWKEKVRPWKKQLKEATKNYGKAQEEFVRQGEGLGPFRFGGLSLTQYQMISLRLNDLNDQMGKYQAQITEANGALEKISKEAQEAEANPDWLE